MEKQFKNAFDEYLQSDEYKEYLDSLERAIAEFGVKSKQMFDSLEYEQRLCVAYHVFAQLHDNEFIDKGSYRHLIYTKLGFSTDAYAPFIDSGLMNIHNSIYSYDDIIDGIKAIFKNLEINYTNKMLLDAYEKFSIGYYIKPTQQLKFDFKEE
jgi:hypothetical protein